MTHIFRRRIIAILSISWLSLSCANKNDATEKKNESKVEISGKEIIVFSASSLSDFMADFATEFERSQHGRIVVQSGGSQILATQIEHGAPFDIFISANQEHAARAQHATNSAAHSAVPQILLQGSLSFVLSPQYPNNIEHISEIAQLDRTIMGIPNLPLGKYSRKLLDIATEQYGKAWRAKFDHSIQSEELNSKAILSKLLLNEADGAFLYRSDWVAKHRLKELSIPSHMMQTADYYIVYSPRLSKSDAQLLSTAFTSSESLALYEKHGLMPASRSHD